jgi:hypothetical protein
VDATGPRASERVRVRQQDSVRRGGGDSPFRAAYGPVESDAGMAHPQDQHLRRVSTQARTLGGPEKKERPLIS